MAKRPAKARRPRNLFRPGALRWLRGSDLKRRPLGYEWLRGRVGNPLILRRNAFRMTVPHSAVLPGSRSCFSLVQDVVGAKWAQLTTPGFSVLNLNRRHLSPSQLVAISRAHDRRRAMLRPIASCCATCVTISVTDA